MNRFWIISIQKMYLDTYLGGEKFSGEEALWIRETPVWAMNYTGRVLSDSFSGNFLKECLSLISSEAPYRGLELHSHGDYTYHNKYDGAFTWFRGVEEIYYLNVCTMAGRFFNTR